MAVPTTQDGGECGFARGERGRRGRSAGAIRGWLPMRRGRRARVGIGEMRGTGCWWCGTDEPLPSAASRGIGGCHPPPEGEARERIAASLPRHRLAMTELRSVRCARADGQWPSLRRKTEASADSPGVSEGDEDAAPEPSGDGSLCDGDGGHAWGSEKCAGQGVGGAERTSPFRQPPRGGLAAATSPGGGGKGADCSVLAATQARTDRASP